MRRILTGQVLLIICCIFYMIWWYRCYRPGEAVNRVGGANGILLLSTAAFGIAGVVLSLTSVAMITPPKIGAAWILAAGIAAVRSPKTINENLSIALLDEIIEENKK